MTHLQQLAQAADLLLALESELRRQHLWQATPPKPDALASDLPFCCDTLDFHQWLQFIFIPGIKTLIETNQPLPRKCGIAPLAEEWFAGTTTDSSKLIALLKSFDELLTEK